MLRLQKSGYDSNEQSDSHDSSENNEDFPAYVFARKKSKKTKIGRSRQKRIGQRYNIETSPVSIRRDLASGCCHRNCLQKLSDVAILRCRQEFHSKSNRGQSEFILQQIKLTHVYDQPDADVTLAVDGKAVCVEGWRKVYFFIKRKVVEYETVTFEDPRTGQLYSSQKLLGAHQFLTEYAKQFGEDQPDSSDVHLPSCVTKASVYEDYQLQCQTNSKPYIKISRFYEMWISEFQHVKLRKFQTFTQCIECTNFKTALLKKPSKEEKKKIIEMRTAHLDLQRLCRQKYYKHNNKAQEDPDQYLSLIIDGMDQAKTNLPRFHNVTKADCKLSKMHHHLTGVLCNSGVLHPYAFTWTDQFAPDADVTINCFMRVLDDISKVGVNDNSFILGYDQGS
ncbi:unnamed protein product [Mytilus edulis]|uniref:DUF7869 domain-containing protein n=1 Tax=Mytilus edulis TaxID=6550 RepID=A0A8S3VA10_MYTED|nr:unnamed protein product [Mytilus edulis]